MIRVGILGLGTVGGGVVKILRQKREDYARIIGEELEIVKVCSRRDHRLWELGLEPGLYTSSFDEFLACPMDIVVEVIGGEAPAEVIVKALDKGQKVVTANKALLANRASEFMGHEQGHNLYFEASCCGGIPIISSFEEGLLSNGVVRLLGIFNGTCNYILSEMAQRGVSFEEVLVEAQRLGYAEADPTFDVQGVDATHKLCLLGSLAFKKSLDFDHISSQGITELEPEDFSWAEKHGYTIKLISMGDQGEEGIFAGTFPCLIPSGHPMANVGGAFNAVYVEGTYVGELMFYGAGAGEMPTASAVVSDILAAAQGRDRTWSHSVFNDALKVEAHDDKAFPFYIRLTTADELGVLARLCEAFSNHGVSIWSVHQNPMSKGESKIVFITHPARRSQVQSVIEELDSASLVFADALMMRILDI